MKNKKNNSDIEAFGKFKVLRVMQHHLSTEASKLIPSDQYLELNHKVIEKINKEKQILAIFNKDDKTEAEHTLEIQSYLLENFIKHLPNKALKDLINTEYVKSNIEDLKIHCPQLFERISDIENSKGLATPNDLRIATMGTKQDLKWGDIDNKHQDKVKELLKSTAPEILNKLEDEENPNEIISKFIGTKLAKKELRILKTLRALVDQAFNLKKIQDYGHKTRIYTANFYKEYGLKPREEGGYEDNQTRSIREILFNGTSNLTKRIFFYNKKNQKVMVTAFILKLEWDTGNNYFEIMLDEIIFVKDKSDKYSYYYENLRGLNRLIELMPNSDSAFELHEYLEYSIKETNHEFGLTKLLRASPTLEKRYTKDKNGTIQRLEKVLDGMVKTKTLISTWQKERGRNEMKYILTNIYKKEKDSKSNNKKAQLIHAK